MLHYGGMTKWLSKIADHTSWSYSGRGLANILNGTNKSLLREYVSAMVKLNDTNVIGKDVKGLLRAFSGTGPLTLDALHPSASIVEVEQRVKKVQQDLEQLGRERRKLRTIKWRLGDVDLQKVGWCIPTTKWQLVQEIERSMKKLKVRLNTRVYSGSVRQIVHLRKKVEELKDVDEVYRTRGPFLARPYEEEDFGASL